MIDLTPIFDAIIALLAALITAKLIPWIKEKTTREQQQSFSAMVRILVYAAEQIYGAGNGYEKMKYVKDQLAERGYKFDEAVIEAEVKKMTDSIMHVFETQEEVTIEESEETEN